MEERRYLAACEETTTSEQDREMGRKARGGTSLRRMTDLVRREDGSPGLVLLLDDGETTTHEVDVGEGIIRLAKFVLERGTVGSRSPAEGDGFGSGVHLDGRRKREEVSER